MFIYEIATGFLGTLGGGLYKVQRSMYFDALTRKSKYQKRLSLECLREREQFSCLPFLE